MEAGGVGRLHEAAFAERQAAKQGGQDPDGALRRRHAVEPVETMVGQGVEEWGGGGIIGAVAAELATQALADDEHQVGFLVGMQVEIGRKHIGRLVEMGEGVAEIDEVILGKHRLKIFDTLALAFQIPRVEAGELRFFLEQAFPEILLLVAEGVFFLSVLVQPRWHLPHEEGTEGERQPGEHPSSAQVQPPARDHQKQRGDQQQPHIAPPNEGPGGLGDIDQLFDTIVEKHLVEREVGRHIIHHHRIGNQQHDSS